MRILVVHPGPNFSVADVHAGWVEALKELGCDVASYNLDDRIQFYSHAFLAMDTEDENGNPMFKKAMTEQQSFLAAQQGLSHALYTMWPDVVIFISAFFITVPIIQVIRARKHKIVMLHTESPYQDESQLVRADFADVNLINDPVNIERYRELDGIAEYMPHAYRPLVHYPRPAGGVRDDDVKSDFAFIGTGFKSRMAFFEQMDFTGIDVLLGGAWLDLPDDSPLKTYIAHAIDECVDNATTARIYRSSRCGINMYRREFEEHTPVQDGWAMGPREVEMAACGLPFLRDSRPEGDAVFPFLPRFTSPEEATGQLRYYLSHEDERVQAGHQARAAVADRTFVNHARRLLQLLDS